MKNQIKRVIAITTLTVGVLVGIPCSLVIIAVADGNHDSGYTTTASEQLKPYTTKMWGNK